MELYEYVEPLVEYDIALLPPITLLLLLYHLKYLDELVHLFVELEASTHDLDEVLDL